MKKRRYSLVLIASLGCSILAGCGSLGGGATEIGLAGLGGAIGYEVTDHKVGGAAAGAAVGYAASKIAQSETKRREVEAEQRGFDRAMNQAVKQQYWIIQNQQRSEKTVRAPAMVPVVIPESNNDGVIRTESVAFVPVSP